MVDARYRAEPEWLRTVARVSLAIVGAVIAVIVFTPGPPDASGQRALKNWLLHMYAAGLPSWIDFALIEFTANVVMFVPIGLLGALALRRRRGWPIAAAAAFSAGIELIQAFTLPGRDGSLHDVVANTVGAAIGYLLALGLLRVLRRRRAVATAAGQQRAEST